MGEFQEGDKVAYDVSYTSEPSYVVSRIKTITPTGRIRLENGVQFNKHGIHIITEYRHYFLRKYDDQVKEAILRKDLLLEIKSINWNAQKTETLRKVIEIINNRA